MLNKELSLSSLTIIGLATSFLIGFVANITFSEMYLIEAQWVVDIVRIVGFLLATSLLGKTVQSVGLWSMVIAFGFRNALAYKIFTTQGVLPNPNYCLGSIAIWVFWLIWKGRNFSIDSDEWKITISTITQLVFEAILLTLIFS